MADNLTLMQCTRIRRRGLESGGVLARYSAEGVRTIVVTCTNGEFGTPPADQAGADATTSRKWPSQAG